MWGTDYPHSEGTAPYTREALRASFAHAAVDECRLMFGKTAADVYGFDVTHLARIAAEIGPAIDEIHRPLHEFPSDTHCGAFDLDAIVRSW